MNILDAPVNKGSITIRAISDTELVSYDTLACEYGTVFHSAAWTSLLGDRLKRYGIFAKNDELVGGFHLFKAQILGMTILRNPPFTPQIGPFFRIKAQNPLKVLEARREILDAVAGFLDHRVYAVVSVSLDPEIQDTLPFVWRKFKVVPGYTYRIDLSISIDQIQRNMSSEKRNDISKAIKDGLTVEQLSEMSAVRSLVLATFERQKKSLNQIVLDAILFRYANDKNSFAYATYRGNRPIAACFVVYNQNTAYYLLAGYQSADRHHGAGALAVFEAIKHSKELGLHIFDFEGSMIPLIETYFRGFGGRLTPYFTVNKAWLPLEMALKFIKRQRF